MTLTFTSDLHRVKHESMNQQTKYIGQRSFSSKVTVCTHTWTDCPICTIKVAGKKYTKLSTVKLNLATTVSDSHSVNIIMLDGVGWGAGRATGLNGGSRCRFAYGPADATATHYLLLQ